MRKTRYDRMQQEIDELREKVWELDRRLEDLNNKQIRNFSEFYSREERRRLEASSKYHVNTRFAGRRGLNAEKLIEVKKLYEQKISVREIAEKTGLSRTTVYKYIKNGFTRKNINPFDDL